LRLKTSLLTRRNFLPHKPFDPRNRTFTFFTLQRMSEQRSVYTGAGERGALMTHPVSLLGAAALGIVLATSCADAQTIHHRAKHSTEVGRQIIVRQGVEPWLTLGTWAPVGSRQGYALDTLQPPQRTSNEGSFSGVRGIDRLPNNGSLPEANRPLLVVSAPGLSGPWLDLY
jgi:hypothetical protein